MEMIIADVTDYLKILVPFRVTNLSERSIVDIVTWVLHPIYYIVSFIDPMEFQKLVI